jgi:phage-related baseplate assembly protein
VANAVSEYITWQTSEIGRDINPDELLQRIKAAGVKRVEMSSPVFTVVKDTQVAQCSAQTVTYGGLEDD